MLAYNRIPSHTPVWLQVLSHPDHVLKCSLMDCALRHLDFCKQKSLPKASAFTAGLNFTHK